MEESDAFVRNRTLGYIAIAQDDLDGAQRWLSAATLEHCEPETLESIKHELNLLEEKSGDLAFDPIGM